MKKTLFLTIIFALACTLLNAQQGIIISSNENDTPHPSATFEVKSTDGGILIPRMTVTERINIVNPAVGLMVYQTDDIEGFYYFDGSMWSAVGNSAKEYAVFEDRKPNGTHGGTATTSEWTTCELNYTAFLIGQSISRTENSITLQPGNYLIRASSPGLYCQNFQIRLWNSTNNATALLGTCAYDENNNGIFGRTQTRSYVNGILSIEETSILKIQYWRNGSLGYADLGMAILGNEEDEIYTRIYIEKIR